MPAISAGLTAPAASLEEWLDLQQNEILHNSLVAASRHRGYQLENPEHGHTATLLGEGVPGGQLDNAAHVFLGEPPQRYSLTIEVKSWRDHVYATSDELYQVLYKAAHLQHCYLTPVSYLFLCAVVHTLRPSEWRKTSAPT